MALRSLALLACVIFLGGNSPAGPPLSRLLQSRGTELLREARAGAPGPREVFVRFVDLVAGELVKSGDREGAARIRSGIMDPFLQNFPRTEFAWITHTFAREFYRDSVIAHTAALIRFKTFATNVPNRDNPEFEEQKEYLRDLALRLGLQFKDVGGYVYEIWTGEGAGSFGIVCHGDVQPVDAQEWTVDPWAGVVSGGKLWGRGSVTSKGPIIAVMYGMKAMLDSGLPIRKKLVLLVGTDEESANEDLTNYLKTRPPPDTSIVVDAKYPVIAAEKGWGGVWLHLRRFKSLPVGEGLLVADLYAGYTPSIIPEKATAKIVSIGGSILNAKQVVAARYELFRKRRPKANFSINVVGDTLYVTARGKSVHSSEPQKGYNALTDLLVFVDRDLQPLRNEISIMAKFVANNIGFEMNGRTLGIAHRDPFMGDLTVAPAIFSVTDTTVMFMFNFRVPRGISREKIQNKFADRFGRFVKKHNIEMFDYRWIGDPTYQDPNGEFVQRLLRIYNSVTGEHRRPQAISIGTYAHRLPNAVVFGPALPNENYIANQPDESLLLSTLMRNVEILTNTMVEFGL
jgi:predicted dipeptidase